MSKHHVLSLSFIITSPQNKEHKFTLSTKNDNMKCKTSKQRETVSFMRESRGLRHTAEECEVFRSVRGVEASLPTDGTGQELHCGLMGKNPNNSRGWA